MKLLLLALALQSGSEDPDWRIHEEIAAERMKVAAELEKLKQFAWARAEYLKVLRLNPDQAEAKARLDGPSAVSRSNQGKSTTLPGKREELLQSVANKAASRFRIRAKELADEKRELEAQGAWRWVLLYAPADPDARRALKMRGKGADALDPVWGEGRWEDLIAKADPGKPSTELSHIDRKWGRKDPKQATANLVLEGVGIPADRLARLGRIAEGTIAFMRLALGDPLAQPNVERVVFISGKENYVRYIDDFIEDKPDRKQKLKATGGTHNERFKEFVKWCYPKSADWLEITLPHKVTECMYPRLPATWLYEGTANFVTYLFNEKGGGTCIDLKEGTDASSGDWSQSTKVDLHLRDKVMSGKDDDIELLLNVTLLTLTPSQLAKCMSLSKFLILRHPQLFRSVVRVYLEEVTIPRQAIEKALGFTLEELDEFWRRWYLDK